MIECQSVLTLVSVADCAYKMHYFEFSSKSLALMFAFFTVDFHTVLAMRGQPVAPVIEGGPVDYRLVFLGNVRNVQNDDSCKCLGYWPRSRATAHARLRCDDARINLNRLQLPNIPICHRAECVPKHKVKIPSVATLGRWGWGCSFYCDPVEGRESVQYDGREMSLFRLSEIPLPYQ